MFRIISNYLARPTMRAIPAQVRRERIRLLFAEKSLKELLDDKFIDGLQKRRDELQGRILKVFAVEVTILGIMLLCLTPLKLNVTLFGVQASDLRQLRELLLVVFASISFRQFQWRGESSFIREVMHAALKARALNNKELLFILEHRFGIGVFPGPSLFQPAPDMSPALGYTLAWFAFRLAASIVVIATGFASLIIEIAIMINIYQMPSFDIIWSVISITYAAIITFIAILWTFLRTTRFLYRGPLSTADPAP